MYVIIFSCYCVEIFSRMKSAHSQFISFKVFSVVGLYVAELTMMYDVLNAFLYCILVAYCVYIVTCIAHPTI